MNLGDYKQAPLTSILLVVSLGFETQQGNANVIQCGQLAKQIQRILTQAAKYNRRFASTTGSLLFSKHDAVQEPAELHPLCKAACHTQLRERACGQALHASLTWKPVWAKWANSSRWSSSAACANIHGQALHPYRPILTQATS